MKAALIKEFGADFVIEETARPQAGPGQALVRVKASCLCPGDLKIRAGRMPRLKLPHIPGHEVAGIVEEVGPGVETFKPGDRVVVYMYQVCGRCPACRQGRENTCANLVRTGMEKPGGHAEFVVVEKDQLLHLPESIPFREAAAIPDAVATSLHAVREMGRTRLNDYVLIYGVGGLGLHGVQLARLAGGRVIAVSRSQSKLDLAAECGAEWTVNGDDPHLADRIVSLTKGRGVDLVIDYVVNQATLEKALACLKKGGRIVNVGSSAPEISLPVGLAMFKEVALMGSLGMDKKCLTDAIELVEAGYLKPYVTETYALEEINKAAERLEAGSVLGRSAILF